jgi:hypothetical protein
MERALGDDARRVLCENPTACTHDALARAHTYLGMHMTNAGRPRYQRPSSRRRRRPRDHGIRRRHPRCARQPVRVGRAGRRQCGRRQGRRPPAPPLLDSIRRTRLALKGPLTTPCRRWIPLGQRAASRGVQAVRNVRPARTIIPGGRYDDIDIVLIPREPRGTLRRVRALHSHRRRPARRGHLVGRRTRVRGRAGSRNTRSTTPSERPQEGHHRPQGERAEGADGHLPRHGARRGEALRGPRRARRPHRRRVRECSSCSIRGSST